MNLDWQRHAACHHPSVQPSDFDTSLVDSRGRPDLAKARQVAHRVCGVCPVRADCLAYAFQLVADGYGPQGVVWGGVWFPPPSAADTHLIDLLADTTDKDHAA